MAAGEPSRTDLDIRTWPCEYPENVCRIDHLKTYLAGKVSCVRNLAQHPNEVEEPELDRSAKLASLLQECLDSLAVGNIFISFGLWESAYHQANLAKTALYIASRPLSEMKRPELSPETAQLLSLAQRDLGALEASLKILPPM